MDERQKLIEELKAEDERQALINELGGTPSKKEDDRGLFEKTLGYLDVPGGIVREALYGELGGLKKEGDVDRLQEGRAVQSKEYLERAGVPSTALSDVFPSIYGDKPGLTKPVKGGLLDPTLSGTLGFASDVVTDPLSYLSKIAKLMRGESKAASVANKVLNPTATVAEKAAYPVYKGGLLKADEVAIKEGSDLLPSRLLFENETYGGVKKAREAAKEIALKDIENRKEIYRAIQPIDTATINYARAEEQLIPLINNSFTKKQASNALEKIAELKSRGVISPEELSQSKSLLQTLAAKSGAYGADPKYTAQSLATGYAAKAEKEALEQAAEKAMAGGGEALRSTNERLGALMGAKKPISNMEAIEMRKGNAFPKVFDFTLPAAAASMSHDPAAGFWTLLAKKIGDFSRTTPARTGAGIGLKKYGKTSMYDTLLRRKLQEEEK